MDTENSAREAEAETGIVAAAASAAQPEPVQGQDIDIAEDSDSEDSLTFSNGVIEKIVAIAMRDVPGVVGMKGSWLNRVQDAFGASDTTKGVSVEVTPESAVKVNVSVLIEYGAYAPQVFEDVKKALVSQASTCASRTCSRPRSTGAASRPRRTPRTPRRRPPSTPPRPRHRPLAAGRRSAWEFAMPVPWAWDASRPGACGACFTATHPRCPGGSPSRSTPTP